ncbi:trypsin-7-like isoform X2 [Periplaneta americana]|uniref:trypsin-7-like isoform X2 n=1 Tax=Periplaneta americana TaxID=6978 RepID=UPI0037E87A29
MFQVKKQPDSNLRCLRMLLFVVVVAGAQVETKGAYIEPIIVGGSDIPIGDYLYQLSLQSTWQHKCGAVMISNEWAITAARCTYGNVVYMSVRTRQSSLSSRMGRRVGFERILYYNYNNETYENDIAAIQLYLPSRASFEWIPMRTSPVEEGTTGFVLGWGKLKEDGTYSDVLQKVSVTIQNTDKCNKILQDNGLGDNMHDGQMCSMDDGKNVCQGNYGTPFIVDGKLAGIVSWGNGCGTEDNPIIYTDISYYYNWLKNITADE